MNMEKTTERYPIRYYSMITVAKDTNKKQEDVSPVYKGLRINKAFPRWDSVLLLPWRRGRGAW